MLHKGLEFSCDTTQFPPIPLCVPISKSHGVWGWIKDCHMWLGRKLIDGTCVIHQIPCACLECTYMLDNTWAPGVTPPNQPRYQPIQYCTHLLLLGCFNNWNSIKFSNKNTTTEGSEATYQVVLVVISDECGFSASIQ